MARVVRTECKMVQIWFEKSSKKRLVKMNPLIVKNKFKIQEIIYNSMPIMRIKIYKKINPKKP